MATFRYRAATAAGALKAGTMDGGSPAQVLDQLRRAGLTPIEVAEARGPGAAARGAARGDAASRRAIAQALGELAVLLGAGLTLDRALGICVDNMSRPAEAAAFAALHQRVTEGAPLSRAMQEAPGLFPPMAAAMAEAGETNGRLDLALARLAETLERNEALRQTVAAALVYPILLLAIAASVVLTMLLWVVPQFEGLFSEGQGKLPPATRAVMAISHAVRQFGLAALGLAAAGGFAFAAWLRQPATRLAWDRWVLRLPQVGPLVLAAELGRFARVLGALVEGGVPAPEAVAIAQRSLTNASLAEAIGRVALALRQGAGITAALSAEGVFPKMALGYVRTGEETAQLGPMLGRLADMLDRDVRLGVERLIAILTPLITVVMGGLVAAVIASIMTAILGFDDLALAP